MFLSLPFLYLSAHWKSLLRTPIPSRNQIPFPTSCERSQNKKSPGSGQSFQPVAEGCPEPGRDFYSSDAGLLGYIGIPDHKAPTPVTISKNREPVKNCKTGTRLEKSGIPENGQEFLHKILMPCGTGSHSGKIWCNKIRFSDEGKNQKVGLLHQYGV